MERPPRPPESPLLAAGTWRRSLVQGGLLTVAALVLAFWPGLAADGRRSLVFGLLLLAGGALVALNGDPGHRLTRLGGLLGLGLWAGLMAIPGLRALLRLAPPDPALLAPLGLVLLVLVLAWPLLAGRAFLRRAPGGAGRAACEGLR